MIHFYENIEGWFDYEYFYKKIISSLSEGANVVEIGSYKGKSLSYFVIESINQNKKLNIYSIDSWENEDDFKQFEKNISNISHLINYYKINSHDGASLFKNGYFDFIFIDANRAYDYVKRDIELWYPKLKDGGIIAGHDYDPCWMGVVDAVNEKFPNDFHKEGHSVWVHNKHIGYKIDKAIYINLDERVDRKTKFENQTKTFSFPIERMKAVCLSDEDLINIGITKNKDPRQRFKVSGGYSHYNAISEAHVQNLNNILIFEDDCIFVDDFQQKFNKLLSELPDDNWDILYLGGEPNNDCLKVTENIYECLGGVYGAHAYLVNKVFFEKLLKYHPKEFTTIDYFYVNFPIERKFYISKECLVYQDDNSFSDLWGDMPKRKKNYDDSYKKYLKI